MQIALISPYSNIPTYGLRILSACLKQEGHKVTLVFLPEKYTVRYKEKVLDELAELVGDSDLIGVSLMSNHFDNAVQITQKLKSNTKTPVIWGGIHPTIRPQECLNYADMVCIGEGEKPLLYLAGKIQDGQSYLDTPNFWFKRDGEIIRNGLQPLVQDLDSIPFQDYDFESQYILHNDCIRKADDELLNLFLQGDYMTLPTRGCPFGCTYCCNNTFNKMYPRQAPRIRKRSIGSIINELVEIKDKLPFLNHITFDDDSFFSYSEDEIKEFSASYKNEVCLPLDIGGSTPNTLTHNKLSLLVDAGLTGMRMGIQTGSKPTKKLYRRIHSNQKVVEAVNIIAGFKDKLLARYDVIINNPWESDEDLAETLMLFNRFPKPYYLDIYSLNLYPGTELYEKGVKEGMISDDLADVYRKSYNVVADGTSGKLLNESYFANLFYLLHIFSLEGIDLSDKTMALLTSHSSFAIKRYFLYFALRWRASLILKKRLIRDIYRSKKYGISSGSGYSRD